MSELDDRAADSQRVTDYLRKKQQEEGGGGVPPVQPPIETVPPITPIPPIEQPKPPEAGSVNLGDLHFDGSQITSTGMSGDVVAYARILIPNPLPPGWSGKQAYVSVFEHASPPYGRRMWMSHEPFDYSAKYPAYSQGNGSANIYMKFSAEDPFTVIVQPGEVWYVTIANQMPNGEPSCPPGGNGNFGIRMYPPNV